MRKSTAGMVAGLAAAGMLVACKSKYEDLGDKYLKANNPINALHNYDLALEKGKVSEAFYGNYEKAYVLTLQARAPEDPMADFIDIYKDTVLSLMRQHPSPAAEAEFAQALYAIGMQRIKQGTSDAEERGFQLLKTADSLPAKPADVGEKIKAARENLVNQKLAQIQKEYQESLGKDQEANQQGILADYHLNELALSAGDTPQMRDLWSKVRQANLSTYLMYDLEGLGIDRVDPRINKYGVLLGITKYDVKGNTAQMQVKAYNGSTGPIPFGPDMFTLVDKAGKSYKPSGHAGFNTKGKPVEMRAESPIGGLTFKLDAGAEPAYLQFDPDNTRSTRKYLP